jgi:competence protein ComEC
LAFALPLAESKIDRLEEKNRFLLLQKILRIFAPVFVIQLGMAPITAYHFFYFSLAAFFINIPIIALSSIILPISIVLIILSIFAEGNLVFGVVATAVELLLKAMSLINQYVGTLSLSSMNVTSPSVLVLALFYGLFFFFTSEEFWRLYRKKNKEKITGFILCILCLSLSLPFIIGENQRKADIVFVDVGQGDCIHLRTPGGKNILIDGGGSREYNIGKKVLLPYLLKNGVDKVDLAIVTHLHEDHYGGISSLCRLMDVEKLGVYASNYLKQDEIRRDTGLGKEQLSYVVAGDRITIEKDIYIEILHPKKRTLEGYKDILAYEKDENLSSLVAKINYRGISILVTGDMGFQGEEYIMNEYGDDKKSKLQSDILKVGHHGSKNSTGIAFLEAVEPKIAVIQVGKNNFGHPHRDVIEKLMEKDIMVFRNDENGAVLINIKPNSIRINTMLP